jgi:undecaprenyl-diphosphatase
MPDAYPARAAPILHLCDHPSVDRVPMGLTRLVDLALLRQARADTRAGRGAGVALSSAARGGGLWAATTAVLAVTGPSRRRAGVEGMAAWAAATAGVGGLKRVVRRRRPPARLAIGPRTRSSSMPSSHSASAVAYAVAAGARSPEIAPVVGALAGGVVWSRLATGRHFPADVGVAVAVGAATGAAVHALARRHGAEPGEPAEPAPA